MKILNYCTVYIVYAPTSDFINSSPSELKDLEVGSYLGMGEEDEDGNEEMAKIVAVDKDTITIDANHEVLQFIIMHHLKRRIARGQNAFLDD